MTAKKSSRLPTTKERAILTRIYGDESNWLGVATSAPKIRRSLARTAILQKSAKK